MKAVFGWKERAGKKKKQVSSGKIRAAHSVDCFAISEEKKLFNTL